MRKALYVEKKDDMCIRWKHRESDIIDIRLKGTRILGIPIGKTQKLQISYNGHDSNISRTKCFKDTRNTHKIQRDLRRWRSIRHRRQMIDEGFLPYV